MMITIDKIKQLREETDISITECKKALEEADGDLEKAKEILRKKGLEWSSKRKEREVGQGIIESYIHSNKRIGAMLELGCESDFVARSEDFQKLAHELCLQIAANSFEAIPILEQKWIKDESKTIKELISEYSAKFGENIVLKRAIRYEINSRINPE